MMLQLSGSYMRGNPGDPNTSPSCVLPVPNPDTFVWVRAASAPTQFWPMTLLTQVLKKKLLNYTQKQD